MPRYMIHCADRPDALEVRLANRPAHLEFLKAQPAGLIRAAGPLLDEAGDMRGSLFLIDAPDIETVRAFAAADPYAQAGLFERVDIQPWRQVVGEPV
jgi:uncharacterized protein